MADGFDMKDTDGKPLADPGTENIEPIDCFKTYGSKFEDCERDWGWDCCMADEVFDLAVANQKDSTASQTENKDPIDCLKTFGPKFADCETDLGWDCCVVGDELDQSDSAKSKGTSKGSDSCSAELGPEFEDCGLGYGLDCCYKDDGVYKHDHNNDSSETGFLTTYHSEIANKIEKKDPLSCSEELGPEFEDCGRGYGLDCCYIDDGVYKHDHNAEGSLHTQNGAHHQEPGIFRHFVLVVMLASVVFAISNRKPSPTSKQGKKSSPISPNDEGDTNREDIELRPLI